MTEKHTRAFYNEIDPFAAAWSRELISDGSITEGVVDERSIADLKAEDLAGFERVHLFAGIGGWDYALKLAGFDPTRPVWTGSCPCQPFSVAGRGRGAADERHLWPEMRRLIEECRPPTIFGEQVASRAGREWLAGVRADLEALGYAVGAADLCAAGIGAPHIRQRLFWMAVAEHAERRSVGLAGQDVIDGGNARRAEAHGEPRARREVRGLANCESTGSSHGRSGAVLTEPAGGSGTLGLAIPGHERARRGIRRPGESPGPDGSGASGELGGPGGSYGVAYRDRERRGERGERHSLKATGEQTSRGDDACGCGEGFWSDYDIIPCGDGKSRRVKRGLQCLAPGLPRSVVRGRDPGEPFDANATAEARVGRLRGYGNSIVPQLAATFIRAFLETESL